MTDLQRQLEDASAALAARAEEAEAAQAEAEAARAAAAALREEVAAYQADLDVAEVGVRWRWLACVRLDALSCKLRAVFAAAGCTPVSYTPPCTQPWCACIAPHRLRAFTCSLCLPACLPASVRPPRLTPAQSDYDALRSRIEPLAAQVEALGADKAALEGQVAQVRGAATRNAGCPCSLRRVLVRMRARVRCAATRACGCQRDCHILDCVDQTRMLVLQHSALGRMLPLRGVAA